MLPAISIDIDAHNLALVVNPIGRRSGAVRPADGCRKSTSVQHSTSEVRIRTEFWGHGSVATAECPSIIPKVGDQRAFIGQEDVVQFKNAFLIAELASHAAD